MTARPSVQVVGLLIRRNDIVALRICLKTWISMSVAILIAFTTFYILA